MFINTTGIVLREVKYSDSTKILTVLTSSEGKLTVSAHGAYRKNSKLAASAGLLVYSHLTLMQKKDRWSVTEAQPIEQFLGLRDDITLLALGAYIAELTETVSDQDSLNPQLLPLTLNTLYALSEKLKPQDLIKPAFELRLMAISGFSPVLKMKDESEIPNMADNGSNDGFIHLSKGAYDAANYILTCNAKKLFSFNLEGSALGELKSAAEDYLSAHLDKDFRTLNYYKRVAGDSL